MFSDADIVGALPKSMRYVVTIAAGYDKLDWKACGKRGILVSHCGASFRPSALSVAVGAVDAATSTTALYLMISALRNFSEAERSARAGTWKRDLPHAHDPEGKTLGIVGMGGIGKALAKRALALDMRISYHNRRPIPANELERLFPGADIEYKATLDELLESSDVVAIGCAETERCVCAWRSSKRRAKAHAFDSAHLLQRAQLAGNVPSFQRCAIREDAQGLSPGQVRRVQHKQPLTPRSIARGEIVDEPALLRALDSGHLYAAGLDVFEHEPSPSMTTLAHPRISVLPHAGTLTIETTRKMEEHAVRTIELALDSGELRDVIPELKS